ncbi:MAG: SCO2522 family protein [Micromonosporaceae bacterium]
MTEPEAVFREHTASPRTAAVPLAHLSIEVGHLYADDFAGGVPRLVTLFRQVAPWVRTAEETCADAVAPRRARVSTCFLIDDYFTPFSSPREVLPQLLQAADEAGVRLDYVARESGCARAGDVDVASLVESRIVAEPPLGTNGSRPPVTESGWLCNGERSPSGIAEAMAITPVWQPPRENAVNRHSVFLDVQLWDGDREHRVWSCPYLAAVWQLLRLGVVRDHGTVVAAPERLETEFPREWGELPAVTSVNPGAAPFWAYRTMSVLGTRFLPIEHAVRTILSQVAVDDAAAVQVLERAGRERITLPAEIVGRIQYVFTGAPWN